MYIKMRRFTKFISIFILLVIVGNVFVSSLHFASEKHKWNHLTSSFEHSEHHHNEHDENIHNHDLSENSLLDSSHFADDHHSDNCDILNHYSSLFGEISKNIFLTSFFDRIEITRVFKISYLYLKNILLFAPKQSPPFNLF